MKHSVMSLIGTLTGLVIGSILVPSAMLAGFTGARVSWDASHCPEGEYTVTATARNTVSGELFQATSSNLSLPAGTITQDFPDLPGGTYVVNARASATDGESFQSASQSFTVAGTSAPPTTSETTLNGGGRSRPSGINSTGTAQPRTGLEASIHVGGGHTANEAASGSVPSPDAAALTRIETEVSLARALETVAELARGTRGGGRVPSHIDVVDEDGDGAIDYVALRIGSVIRVWRVSGSAR